MRSMPVPPRPKYGRDVALRRRRTHGRPGQLRRNAQTPKRPMNEPSPAPNPILDSRPGAPPRRAAPSGRARPVEAGLDPLIVIALEGLSGTYAARGQDSVAALLRRAIDGVGIDSRPARPARGDRPDRQAGTDAERKIVQLVTEGLSNPQVGQRLFVSPRTVQTHVAHVFAKLHVSTRAELAAFAAHRAAKG
jgi:DNA-binding CsgD family transcriptional regulator